MLEAPVYIPSTFLFGSSVKRFSSESPVVHLLQKSSLPPKLDPCPTNLTRKPYKPLLNPSLTLLDPLPPDFAKPTANPDPDSYATNSQAPDYVRSGGLSK